ncbi:MAG: hypothetical protein AB1896_19005, partial [Thermodesulfobacteriota bacterium]
MAVKAFFAHAGLGYWLDVAAYLRDRRQWEICYLQGHESQVPRAAELLPEAVFHTHGRAKKAEPPAGMTALRLAPLDDGLLRSLAFHETIFLKMMDRYDLDGKLTYQKRVFHYHRQMMLWQALLEHFRPDVVVFRTAPHMGFDYALYALCRVTGVPTLMFERTAIKGRLFPVESFETGSDPLRAAYAEKSARKESEPVDLSEPARTHLANLKRNYTQAMPFHLRYKLEKFSRSGNVGGLPGILFRTAVNTVRAALSRHQEPGLIRRVFQRNIGLIQKKKLREYYERQAGPVDLDRPFIFAALQCEPERQTCPVGGIFGHQHLMVDLLSRTVPEGWMVYVKEHVSQFKAYQLAERARSREFYDYLLSRPNVRLVPLDTVSFDLIDRALASATISGTVGWESLARGKPALLFGNSWYMDCRGVFKIRDRRDLAAALRQIQNGYRVQEDWVQTFAAAVEKVSTIGYIDKIYDKASFVSPEENVANLAESL